MRITAIIPAYNCARYLADAIRSVLDQSRPADEVIVVDDGSTDDTPQVAQRFGDRIVYVRTVNQGAAAARNVGLDRAGGDAIAFLDADDAWYPDKLRHQVEVLERYPEVQAVCCEFGLADEGGRVLEERYIKRKYRVFGAYGLDWPAMFPGQAPLSAPGPSHEAPRDSSRPPATGRLYYGDAYRALFLGNFINTSSIVLRRGAVERAGRFTVGRRTQEDYEYWLRVAGGGALAYLDVPLLLFRRRPNQLTADDQKLRIAQDTMDVVRGEAGTAIARLGRKVVAVRIGDRYRALALAQLGAGHPRDARRALAGAWSEGDAGLTTLGLYVLSWVPDSWVRAVRGHKRRLSGGR